MKEVHVGPMTVEGSFHIGKITEVVVADLYTRWQLFTNSTSNITLVHDSWNTYGPERSRLGFDQREELIQSYKKTKSLLGLLPSADLQVESGILSSIKTQEFRDDDPENELIVNSALRFLKNQGIVITGIIEGEKGLYFDIDRVLGIIPFQETLNSLKIFPNRYNASFSKSLDRNNDSSYLGKIPITKKRSFGLSVNSDLLEGANYYEDPRFSYVKDADNPQSDDLRVCVAPLFILALLPYIRHQYTSGDREIDFISNGIGSSVRFNLVSILLNKSLGIDEPYNNIHLYGKLDVVELTDQEAFVSKDWAMKVRYIIFDQLTKDHKTIKKNYTHISDDGGMLEVPEFDAFIKRFFHVKHVTKYDSQAIFPQLKIEEIKYLYDIGFFEAMNQLDYAKAFRKVKDELAKRAKLILQGVNQNDFTLLKAINLFFPKL